MLYHTVQLWTTYHHKRITEFSGVVKLKISQRNVFSLVTKLFLSVCHMLLISYYILFLCSHCFGNQSIHLCFSFLLQIVQSWILIYLKFSSSLFSAGRLVNIFYLVDWENQCSKLAVRRQQQRFCLCALFHLCSLFSANNTLIVGVLAVLPYLLAAVIR